MSILFYFEFSAYKVTFNTVDAILKKKLNILVRLASVDGAFVPKEKQFIREICERHGLDRKAVEEVMANPEPIGSLGAISYQTNVQYLTEILLLMLVDGKVLQSEVLFCEDMGLRLGYTKKSIDALISRIRIDMEIDETKLKRLVLELPNNLKA